jgi:glucose-6-phosphate isomerase, archaeal
MTSTLDWSFDRRTLAAAAGEAVVRRASDLRGVFLDESSWAALAGADDPVVYRVTSIERPEASGGDLAWGLGVIEAGRVGDEYFMTKGHAHARQEAAEIYIGLSGEGLMLLEDLRDGSCAALPLRADEVVYVPGFTAHRTVNVGDEPLGYLGIYPADAGHDYAAVAEKGFTQVVLAAAAGPRVLRRAQLRGGA